MLACFIWLRRANIKHSSLKFKTEEKFSTPNHKLTNPVETQCLTFPWRAVSNSILSRCHWRAFYVLNIQNTVNKYVQKQRGSKLRSASRNHLREMVLLACLVLPPASFPATASTSTHGVWLQEEGNHSETTVHPGLEYGGFVTFTKQEAHLAST